MEIEDARTPTERETLGEKLHIAHVINGLSAGGAETMLVTNLRHLDRQHMSHSVISVHDRHDDNPFWEPELERLEVSVRKLGVHSRVGLVSAGLSVARWARVHQVDVLHAHLSTAMMMARVAAITARLPLVTTLHSLSYEPEILAEYKNPHSRKHDLARIGEGLLHSFVDDLVIAVGETVAQSALRRMHVRRERLRVVPNPLDLSRRSKDPAGDRAARRAQLMIPPDAALILHVGRVVPLKGHRDVVQALQLLERRGVTAHFVVVGPLLDEVYVSHLRREARERGVGERVHLVGSTPDIATWHAAADLFVFPSRYEGLPIALVEALASGLPCVASDIPSNREVLAGGAYGELTALGDAARLADAIERTLGNPPKAKSRASAGRNAVLERYDPHRIAKLHEAIYRELAASRVTRRAGHRDR